MAKILVTDDSEFIRDMLGTIIEDEGHTVIGIAAGEELINAYEIEKPDIVFLDVVLPDRNGLDVLSELMGKHSDAKVIICSAMSGMSFMTEDAIKRGAVCCIKKPFSAGDIEEAIRLCEK